MDKTANAPLASKAAGRQPPKPLPAMFLPTKDSALVGQTVSGHRLEAEAAGLAVVLIIIVLDGALAQLAAQATSTALRQPPTTRADAS